jgi:hypothetical protein
MTVEQTVIIPDDYRIFLELPRSVPCGIEATVKIKIPASEKIDEVRRMLREEMAQNGTDAASGDGWETHVREHYAES